MTAGTTRSSWRRCGRRSGLGRRSRREFVEAGRNAFAWHNIDAELAQLTYDSDRDADRERGGGPSGREAASIRALTFTSAHLTIELEVAPDSLLGQIVPAQARDARGPDHGRREASSPADEIGCFAVSPIPASPFRLRCRTDDGRRRARPGGSPCEFAASARRPGVHQRHGGGVLDRIVGELAPDAAHRLGEALAGPQVPVQARPSAARRRRRSAGRRRRRSRPCPAAAGC